MMTDNYHKSGLYRWKRQEDQRVYSRSQKVTSNDDIHNWIKKVEEASNRAAEEAFGLNHATGRKRGKAVARAAKDLTQNDEEAYSEAQDLLSQWMDEKVNLHDNMEPDIDDYYDDDSWQRHEIQSDVKREWDKLLADNLEDYELPLSSQRSSRRAQDIYNFNEDDAVASVMQNMLEKQVVKKEFKKDLGLNKWDKQTDPKTKMQLRQQQVKENREKREAELKRRLQEQQNKKEAMHRAKTMVMKEEKEKEMSIRREEMKIRAEMTKIRKEMQEERRKIEEKKAREKKAKEEALIAARTKIAWEEEEEEQHHLEEQKKQEERERLLNQRLKELEAREVANNLKVLHRHFSAWYNIVLDRRLKMGKARALADWKLILRAWNAWRSFARERRLEVEVKHHEQEAINTQRNQQKAERHSREKLLHKYFIAWQVWVRSEQERRELEQAQNNTRNKMMSLLEAAASGKLTRQEGSGTERSAQDQGSARSSARDQGSARSSGRDQRKGDKPTTADKIHALFQNTRKLPQVADSVSSEWSDVTMATGDPNNKVTPPSRVPTQAWQVTRKHLNLTPEEMANIGDGEPEISPEEMNAKILKKYGRQPWHKLEVSSYEHRHKTQKKILDEQKRQILEQQRLIEELQFKSTHVELQKQLAEQKLALQTMAQKAGIQPQEVTADGEQESSPTSPKTPSTVSGKRQVAKAAQKAPPPNTTPANHRKITEGSASNQGPNTDRTGSTTNRSRPVSARTDVSKPASFTSTASEKSKYLQVMKRMDDRAAERARLKAEREEKRRKAEEERLAILEAEEAARKKEEEEEKRARVEAYKERKRQEKQRELDRQLKEEKLRQQNELADQHYQRSILKYRGLVPLKKLVAMAKEHEALATKHYSETLQRKVVQAWYHTVKEEWREKEALADEMHNFLCVKHCYQNWKLYKHHQLIQEHKAVRHFQLAVKTKVFQAWRDYANEEKVASWEKERRAREHYKKLLMRRHFKAWYHLPEEVEKERQREKRREELRRKVSSILPDFEISKSLDKSVDSIL